MIDAGTRETGSYPTALTKGDHNMTLLDIFEAEAEGHDMPDYDCSCARCFEPLTWTGDMPSLLTLALVTETEHSEWLCSACAAEGI